MAFGTSPFNPEEDYEITTFSANHFTIKFTERNGSKSTIYAATRVIIPPPLTFMQKYGMSLLMAGLVIIQVARVFMQWLMIRWLSEDLRLVLLRKRSQSRSKWVNSVCLWE